MKAGLPEVYSLRFHNKSGMWISSVSLWLGQSIKPRRFWQQIMQALSKSQVDFQKKTVVTLRSSFVTIRDHFLMMGMFSSSWFFHFWIAIVTHKTRKDLGGVSVLILQDKMLADTNSREKELNFVPFWWLQCVLEIEMEKLRKRETRPPTGCLYYWTFPVDGTWWVPQAVALLLKVFMTERAWAENYWVSCFTPGT